MPHGEGLPAAGLAVGEDGRVAAFHHEVYQRPCSCLVKVLGGILRSKDVVELEGDVVQELDLGYIHLGLVDHHIRVCRRKCCVLMASHLLAVQRPLPNTDADPCPWLWDMGLGDHGVGSPPCIYLFIELHIPKYPKLLIALHFVHLLLLLLLCFLPARLPRSLKFLDLVQRSPSLLGAVRSPLRPRGGRFH